MTDIYHFIEWNRRQGHKILKTESAYWVSAGMGTYQAVPYHAVISPTEEELQSLFHEHKAVAIRYSTPVEYAEGSLSYHVVYDKQGYALNDLPKKARHDIKRGLSTVTVSPIPLSRLATEGWKLRYETLERQKRTGAESKEWWSKLCSSTEGLGGFEAWGATVDGKLTAALLGMQFENTYCIFYQQSLTDFLRFGVNNALTYIVTSEILQRPGVNQVFYGLHSLDAPSSVDEYKFRMGYYPKPVRQRIVFSPFLQPLVNPLNHSMLKLALRLFPQSYLFAKAEGMFRFYLNGKLPLEQQQPPTALVSTQTGTEIFLS
jgi:hypothetical protein